MTLDRAIAYLRTPAAIRERCARIYGATVARELASFRVRPERLDPLADRVIAVTRETYGELARVPPHARWRHFAYGGLDRAEKLAWPSDRDEAARARFDLVITSVLLDAGAGERWQWREPETGTVVGRSEGLALASLHAFGGGLFSARSGEPLRADAEALVALDEEALAHAFQVSAENPLVGLEGAVPRPGVLYDRIAELAGARRGLPAADVLAVVLDSLGTIWPGRITLGGVNLGDTWRHPLAGGEGETAGLVPFHKLSQWLTYSLLEPLAAAGVEVTELDGLTGLPEYRNGGLFVDGGVLEPSAEVRARVWAPGDAPIVEWRALTVVLLDAIAGRVRAKLGTDARALPLAKILEGGTWSAGRLLAREARPDGAPPIRIVSDGTVF
jgi:hypothetical protein